MTQNFEIKPLPGPLGAEIIGLDLSKTLDAEDFATIHRAHLQHHVLVFRKQRMQPEHQIAISKRFGPLQIHVLKDFQLPGYPEIMIVSNIKENDKPIGLGDAGIFWHSDLSYVPTPSLGSMLHAQELPSEGGDTLFADQHTAWETLPDDLKQTVAGLQAEHSYLCQYETLRAKSPWRPKLTQAQVDAVPPVVHPVVRTHPETGRKTLFVSEHFTTRILGLSPSESDDLLQRLFAHATATELVYRHSWQPNDLVFWDNRSVIHLAAGTPDHLRRKLFRTTIEGDAPY
jgi:taurine dioxygenase